MTKTGKALAALAACAVIAAALLSPNLGEARGGGGGGHGHASNYCTICARDSHGRIARSPEARQEFMTQTGYPHGRPGYVVDHIIPLKRGGADAPWNMQWQTIAAGKAKDARYTQRCLAVTLAGCATQAPLKEPKSLLDLHPVCCKPPCPRPDLWAYSHPNPRLLLTSGSRFSAAHLRN